MYMQLHIRFTCMSIIITKHMSTVSLRCVIISRSSYRVYNVIGYNFGEDNFLQCYYIFNCQALDVISVKPVTNIEELLITFINTHSVSKE